MTDSHDPHQIDPLDDLASAHLDGQTTPAEDAQVAGDPAVAARVAELAAVRAAMQSDGPPVDEVRREASIAAALAAFDEGRAEAAAPAGSAGVTPIAVAAARRRVSRRNVQVIGAVAVAVALAVAVPLLGVLDSDSPSEDLATSPVEESAEDTAERDGGDAAGGAADDFATAGPLAMSPTAPVDLGTFEDLDALEAAVATHVAAPFAATTGDQASPTTAARTAEAASACSGADDAGQLVLTGTATLEDRPVLVFVHESTDGARTVRVVDAVDCSTISTRPLE